MTGAGFGGCAIALVKKESINEFVSLLTDHYKKMIGYKPGVFASAPGDGVREV
jgi:galactokinase